MLAALLLEQLAVLLLPFSVSMQPTGLTKMQPALGELVGVVRLGCVHAAHADGVQRLEVVDSLGHVALSPQKPSSLS